MHPTKTLTDREVADWWDALAVWQRALWLKRQNGRNITTAQFAWDHLTDKEQTDIWICRAKELSK